jgi:hypothetical protein
MGPFKRSSNGNKYVVTAVDYVAKWMEAKALREISAETVAKFIIEQIVLRSGLPRIIQTPAHQPPTVVQILHPTYFKK